MISEFNRQIILDTLRLHGVMSRAELAKHLHLSFPAISSNVKGLLEMGYIKEIGFADSSVGRKSALLAFNAERGYIIGVDMGRFRVRMMLTDLLGNKIAHTEVPNPIKNGGDGSQSIGLICKQLQVLLEKSGKPAEDVLCIVIGIPGLFKDGEIYLSTLAEKYTEKDLRKAIGQSFEADVIIQNNTTFGAIGEQWRGVGAGFQNIAYISYGVGLGSAHIVDGKPFIGANNATGEMGFMVVDRGAIRNQFGELGPLEEMLSQGKVDQYFQGGNFREEIVKLIQDYQHGELWTKAVVDEIALNFGIALINLCALFNPEIVIISGGLGVHFGKLFLDQWISLLKCHLPFVPEVRLSDLNNTEVMLGAVRTGINHIHTPK